MSRAAAWVTMLLLLLAVAERGRARFTFRLQVSSPGTPEGSLVPTPVLLKSRSSGGTGSPPALPEAPGLALASDPGGSLNFLAMVDNLQGDSGRGYYLELFLGTPPQKVGAALERGWWNHRGRFPYKVCGFALGTAKVSFPPPHPGAELSLSWAIQGRERGRGGGGYTGLKAAFVNQVLSRRAVALSRFGSSASGVPVGADWFNASEGCCEKYR